MSGQEKFMKKEVVLGIVLDVLFLAVYTFLFFVIGGFNQHVSVWASTVFVWVAFIISLATHALMKSMVNKKILGYPHHLAASYYFRIECVIAVVFMIVRSGSTKVAILIQTVLLAVYLVLLLLKLIFAEKSKDEESKEVTPTK